MAKYYCCYKLWKVKNGKSLIQLEQVETVLHIYVCSIGA